MAHIRINGPRGSGSGRSAGSLDRIPPDTSVALPPNQSPARPFSSWPRPAPPPATTLRTGNRTCRSRTGFKRVKPNYCPNHEFCRFAMGLGGSSTTQINSKVFHNVAHHPIVYSKIRNMCPCQFEKDMTQNITF